MAELLPCRSCGGKAKVEKLFSKKRYDCFCICTSCGRSTKAYRSKQNAVKAWNRGDAE